MGEALGLECWCWRQRAWNLPVSGFRPEASLLLCSLERRVVGVARVVSGRTQKMKGQELWVSSSHSRDRAEPPGHPQCLGSWHLALLPSCPNLPLALSTDWL